MRILICGANGFIGRAIADRLAAAGHEVIRGVRQPHHPGDIAIDYRRDHAAADWLPRLTGIDAVVNAIGILVENRDSRFEAIHQRAPQALFAACAQAGVRRVVQISALGAADGDTAYFTTKRAADEFLMSQAIDWQVLRPSLVYGDDGDSARFFRLLASLPVVGLPGDGGQGVQPVHIDDLTEAVERLLAPSTPPRQCVDLVGATAVPYRAMLASYRAALGFAPACQIAIPAPLIGLAAHVLGCLPGAILTPDTWKMLRRGNTADVAATAALLGRAPRGLHDFIAARAQLALRHEALATWRKPLLRGALAIVWLVTAALSAGLYPRDQSLALLAAVGLHGASALAALYGAAALDAVMGLATLFRPGRRLWWSQIALIAGYTLIIAGALPEYLIHPFGPVLKNLPILALLALLLAEEPKP